VAVGEKENKDIIRMMDNITPLIYIGSTFSEVVAIDFEKKEGVISFSISAGDS